jgi:calcineurin-like phosphoesterase family protein
MGDKVTLWFTSDPHFGHANILKMTGDDGKLIRPGFSCIEDMDNFIVERWNAVVRISDHVYILGDVTMDRKQLPSLNRLNGHLRLVRGNHDIFHTRYYLQYFKEIYGSRVLDKLIFTHIPIHPNSMGRFTANVHGHLHQNASPPGPYFNVCVEQTDYRPLTLEEIKERIQHANQLS